VLTHRAKLIALAKIILIKTFVALQAPRGDSLGIFVAENFAIWVRNILGTNADPVRNHIFLGFGMAVQGMPGRAYFGTETPKWAICARFSAEKNLEIFLAFFAFVEAITIIQGVGFRVAFGALEFW
jgi:hypothetical protein